jgi:hypothetical protein
MRVRQAILIPVIVALSAAGSFLAGSAVPVAAAQTHSAHVHTVAAASPNTLFHE